MTTDPEQDRQDAERGQPGLGLLDTSVVIRLRSLSEQDLPRYPVISAITLAELSVGPLVAKTSEERRSRQAVLQQTEADFDPLPFDSSAARAFGQVAAALRQAGRKTSAGSYDAMIAAVALANSLPLYTANPSDFEGINDLEVLSVGSR